MPRRSQTPGLGLSEIASTRGPARASLSVGMNFNFRSRWARTNRSLPIDLRLHNKGRLKCNNFNNHLDAVPRDPAWPLALLAYHERSKSRQLDCLSAHNAVGN